MLRVYPLCEHLDGLVDTLRKLVPAALQEFDEQAIHKSRVTTRRLKAALDLLDPLLNAEHRRPFARAGRRLRRRLGPLRDLDVMLGHLARIKSKRHAPAIAWLRENLLKQREATRNASSKKAPPEQVVTQLGSWWALRRDVIQADAAVSQLLADSLHKQLADFSQRASLEHGDPHQLRIAGKLLRYTLELADAQGHALPKMVLKTFKRMQERLGAWHDFVVLSLRALQATLAENLALHNAIMQRQILALADYAMRRSQRELDEFSKLWAETGGELTQAINDRFPVEKAGGSAVGPAATVSKTDRDPSDSPSPPTQATDSASDPPAA